MLLLRFYKALFLYNRGSILIFFGVFSTNCYLINTVMLPILYPCLYLTPYYYLIYLAYCLLPYRLLPYCLLPYCLLPYCLLPYCLLPYRLLPYCLLPYYLLPYCLLLHYLLSYLPVQTAERPPLPSLQRLVEPQSELQPLQLL